MNQQSTQRRTSPLATENSVDLDNNKEQWVPIKLNWTTVLYDENIFIDSQLYRKWNRQLTFDDQHLIDKDLSRTRSSEPYFQKTSTRMLLKRITTFYCINNKVHYQQGLLQVVIPFALLRRNDFETRKCYAYFNAFMRKCFPRVLSQKTLKNKNELPHAILAITLTQILLRYHQKAIYQIFNNHEIPLSMVVTQEILTVFARNLELPLVYQIFNFYINKKNKNYILYLAVALISIKKQDIIIYAQKDQLHTYANKQLKNFRDKSDLQYWFNRAEEIEQATPKSFISLSKKVGFCDRSFFTYEDYERMLQLQNWLIDYIMPIYREQIDEDPQQYVFLLLRGEVPAKNYRFIRLSITQSDGTIIYNEEDIIKVPTSKTLVIGYTQENQQEQKSKLSKLIKEIDIMTNYAYRFMMFQDKLKTQKTCDIY